MYVPVQPKYVRVIDENTKNTLSTGATLGPINEGSTIALYCESGIGKPVPTVEWFKDDQPLEGKIYNVSYIFSLEWINLFINSCVFLKKFKLRKHNKTEHT